MLQDIPYDAFTWSMGRKIGTIGDFPILAPESPRIVSLSDHDYRCFGHDDNAGNDDDDDDDDDDHDDTEPAGGKRRPI